MLLGQWQARRADEKRAAAQAAERVALRGALVAKYTVYLDNRLLHGRPGYHVLQPLRLDGGAEHVLVNRGWIAVGAQREVPPPVRTPTGEVVLEGVRRDRLPRAMEAGDAPAGNVWQNAGVAAFAAWSGLTLRPWVLEQHSPLDDGLAREWPRPGAGVETHESYSLQWYSFAALSLALLAALGWRRDDSAAG